MANSGWAVDKNLARLEGGEKVAVVKRKPVVKKASKVAKKAKKK
jgi:hypothetical protein